MPVQASSSSVQGGGIFRELIDLLTDTAFKCNCSSLMQGVAELEKVVSASRLPFEVAFFGRMKTGKSSLINAYIRRTLAITGVEEATATINKLTYGEEEQCKTFTVHWKDRIPEAQTFPLESLQTDWNGKAPEVLDRISQTAYLELYAPVKALRDVHIIDTPGTGSAASEHEDMARQFISGRQTDALVYVFPPVGRETDEEALAIFRKGCVENSSPYNSVAVLHKWDHIYWNNGGNWEEISSKAARMHRIMDRMVAEVIPVSAPLALAARSAPLSFWKHAWEACTSFDEEEDLTDELEDDDTWNKAPERASLYAEAKVNGLPWSSFQVLLRHLYRTRPATPEDARRNIEDFSGIRQLEDLLERRFFKRAALLQQRKMRADARFILGKIDEQLGTQTRKTNEEREYLRRIAEYMERAGSRETDMVAWLNNRLYTLEGQLRDLQRRHIEIDRLRLRIKAELSNNEASLDLLPWLDEHPDLFATGEMAMLRGLLQFGPESAPKNDGTYALFASLQRKGESLGESLDDNTRQQAKTLCNYLRSIAKAFYTN